MDAFLVRCARCGHMHTIRADRTPRSGRFSLKCKSCRQMFDGDTESAEPTEWTPPPGTRQAPGRRGFARRSPSTLRGPRGRRAETHRLADRYRDAVRAWGLGLFVCCAALIWFGLAVLGGRSDTGAAAGRVALAWVAASALGLWAYRKKHAWARSLGVSMAWLQLVGGVLGVAFGAFAAYRIMAGRNVPYSVRELYVWRGWTGIAVQTALAAGLLLPSWRLARRAPLPDGSIPGPRLLPVAGGALLTLSGLLVVWTAYSADFYHVPFVRVLRRYSLAFFAIGLATATVGVRVGSQALRRRVSLALAAALVASLASGWAYSELVRRDGARETLDGITRLEASCEAAVSRERRQRWWRHRFSLNRIWRRHRARVRVAAAPGHALYDSDSMFKGYVDAFWRYRVRKARPAAADINFCHPAMIDFVRSRVRRYTE